MENRTGRPEPSGTVHIRAYRGNGSEERLDNQSTFQKKRQQGTRKDNEGRTAGFRLRRVLVSVLMVLVVLISCGAVGFLVLQISGKNRLYSKADSSELVSTLAGMAVALENGSQEQIEEAEVEDWQEGDIWYNGIHYRYNEDVLTFLFLGIDKMSEVESVEDGVDGGQSDALFLLVLDPHKKKISVIGIPRDTITEIEIYDRDGNFLWTGKGQITLQHGYGDGAQLSCERSVRAVSKLFYGLPIHGYCSINMGAVPVLNDEVGGINLIALETLDFGDFRVQEGEAIYLEGMDAYYYLHNRDVTSFNSAGRRLQRQVQYLEAYAVAAIAAVKADITFPVTVYNDLSRYMVTDISVDEVSYLAVQAVSYSFERENLCVLAGETLQGEEFEEFYVNEVALYELILEVFYEDVG